MTAPLCALPMEMKCEIFSQLSDRDRLHLKGVCKSLKNDVEVEYPKHMARLNTARRIELGWMKFQDRPLYQKVGLVALCIVFSPVIALYHSKDIIGWISTLYTPRIQQLVKQVCKIATRLICTTADWCLDKVFRISKCMFDNIVVPLGRAVKYTAQVSLDKVFCISKYIFDNIAVPLGRAVKYAAQVSYDWILTPAAKAIKELIIGIVIPASRFMLTRIVIPACRFSINRIIVPCTRFVFQNIAVPACKRLVQVMTWTYSNIATPIARLVHAVAKGLLLTLPQKVYQFVLTPIGHVISRISDLALTYILKPVYRHVLAPIGGYMHLAGKITYERVLTPLAQLTEMLARVVFVQIPIETYNFIVLQAQIVQRYFARA